MLADRNAHGWELSERLKDIFPLRGSLPDVSTVYRVLADLEAQGAVRSELTPGDGGGRKVYELTEVGWDLLGFWEAQFSEEQLGLVRLLKVFKQTRLARKRPDA